MTGREINREITKAQTDIVAARTSGGMAAAMDRLLHWRAVEAGRLGEEMQARARQRSTSAAVPQAFGGHSGRRLVGPRWSPAAGAPEAPSLPQT
jgi:hypothetical protein